MSLVHAEFSGRIIGCCLGVHQALGPRLPEKIYEEAVCIELNTAGLKVMPASLAFVINFARPVLDIRRVVLTQ